MLERLVLYPLTILKLYQLIHGRHVCMYHVSPVKTVKKGSTMLLQVMFLSVLFSLMLSVSFCHFMQKHFDERSS